MSKRHSLALLPLLSILAISPSELQRIAKRGIASEVATPQVVPAKEEVKTEVKAEEKKDEVKTTAVEPKKEEAKAEVAAEPKKDEVKVEVVKATKDEKKDEKKEEAKPAVLVVAVKPDDKKDVKKEENKEEKKEDKKDENCEHQGEAKVLSEQVKLLIAQQTTITSNFNQLQQVLQQMNMKQIELEFKMMNMQQPQPFPQMNTYGNWNQFQPNLIPSSQPEMQIPYGMGMYGGGIPYSQPVVGYGGMGGGYMGQSYQPFQGQNPYAPVMQNQSPVDYFGNYQPQTPSMHHDPRFSLAPVRPGSFGIDNLGFDMSTPVQTSIGIVPSSVVPQIPQPQRTSIGFVPSQLQPFQSAPQPQTQPAPAAPTGPTYTVQM